MIPVAATIKQLEQVGLSLNEIATRAGVSPASVHGWRGGKHAPRPGQVVALDTLRDAVERLGVKGVRKMNWRLAAE